MAEVQVSKHRSEALREHNPPNDYSWGFAILIVLALGGTFFYALRNEFLFAQSPQTPIYQSSPQQIPQQHPPYVQPQDRVYDEADGTSYRPTSDYTLHDIQTYMTPLIEERMRGFENRVKKLEDKSHELDTKSWLLAVALNENAVRSREIGRRIDATTAGGYVTVDSGWYLTKMPTLLSMDPQTRRTLASYVKEKPAVYKPQAQGEVYYSSPIQSTTQGYCRPYYR